MLDINGEKNVEVKNEKIEAIKDNWWKLALGALAAGGMFLLGAALGSGIDVPLEGIES